MVRNGVLEEVRRSSSTPDQVNVKIRGRVGDRSWGLSEFDGKNTLGGLGPFLRSTRGG